jgi:hypothetical protein
LLDFFRGVHPWPQLYRLIDRLPTLSHFQRALADDDEVADAALRRGHGSRRGRPPVTEWDQFDELLATIADGVNSLRQTVIAVNTPKGKKVPPLTFAKRPLSAVERIERRRERAVLDEIVAKATPDYRPR